MVETADLTDPRHGIPVFSLYGEVRRPSAAMIDASTSSCSISRTSAAASTPS